MLGTLLAPFIDAKKLSEFEKKVSKEDSSLLRAKYMGLVNKSVLQENYFSFKTMLS